ncbi:MAG: HAMP domain-containing histidine kinase [Clostridia bacterium]|nr:HAMP domain-containing histidine kinase [Clostridia bacterium]
MRECIKEKWRKRRLGVRPRLFLALAALTLLSVIVLWVFQIRLLGYFYEREKFSEIQELANNLSTLIGDEEFASQVQTNAEGHGACICVYRIEHDPVEGEKRTAVSVANAEGNNDCMIHHMPGDQLSKIYDLVRENGGVYDRRLELHKDFDSNDEAFRVPGFHSRGTSINAIHARLLMVDNDEYLMILDTQLTPVDAVVKTLEVQFSWIMMALLIAAFLVAFLTSRMIARPLTDITEKAKGLARGNYSPDFSGKGYREVQELADALNFAAAEIGATDRLQKELIANISHDLRTPLTMIKGYSEMMRDIPGENSPENVQAIIDETTRLTELVNDLMDLSKLQSGMQNPTPTVFDLTATVRDTMHRYETLIHHQGYRIEFLHFEGEATVKADRTMILQVIYNLINNAVNYAGESKRVTVTQTVQEGRVRLSIADDGEGIPPDKIPEIWDRYYRVDKVHNRSVIGTGLGLSIVKSILEAHNAFYGVESAVGVGSVFWFELPLWNEKEE